MIPLTIRLVQVPTDRGLAQVDVAFSGVAWVSPEGIDTVTTLDDKNREALRLGPEVRSVVRYDDKAVGFRLFFVEERAEYVARQRMRAMIGEDPTTPDFSAAFRD
jgi:hypothetical protein